MGAVRFFMVFCFPTCCTGLFFCFCFAVWPLCLAVRAAVRLGFFSCLVFLGVVSPLVVSVQFGVFCNLVCEFVCILRQLCLIN